MAWRLLKPIRTRLALKFTLTMLFFGFVPIVLSGWMFIRVANRFQEQKILRHLAQASELRESYILTYLDRLISETRLMAALPGLGECVMDPMPDERPECGSVVDAMSRYAKLDPRIIELYLMAPDTAAVLYSTDPAQLGKLKIFSDYFLNGRHGPYVSSIYYSFVLDDLAVTISAPVYCRGGELMAVMAVRAAVGPIPATLAGFGAEGRGERVFLVTRFNFVIASDAAERGYPFRELAVDYPVDQALRGIRGAGGYVNHRGVEVYGAWRWIEPLQVALITEQDYEREMAPLLELRRLVIMICLAAGLLLTVMVLYLGRGFAFSIQSMVRVAERFGAGDLQQRLEVRHEDERGRLARSFNEMAQALESRQQEMLQTHEELESAYDELKSLDKMKTALLSNVSHELRTPLSSILGYSELISSGKMGDLNQPQKHGLDVMLRNAQRLEKLIENLLEFTGMEAGLTRFLPTRFDLVELMRERVDFFLPVAERSGLRLDAELPGRKVMIRADQDKIGRMLDNLLDNAIKFTVAGGVVILALDIADHEARIVVQDNGVGIPRELIDKIFERFFQVDYSTVRRWGGIGIGLSIVKEIVETHGGTIKVGSIEGEGTRFEVALPLGGDEPSEAEGPVRAPGTRPPK